MALNKYYSTGTVSVSNGSTAVTGSGTSWLSTVKADDVFCRAGYSVRVASVTDDTNLVLAENWPGTTLSGSAYEIRITFDGPEFLQTARKIWSTLSSLVFYVADSVSATYQDFFEKTTNGTSRVRLKAADSLTADRTLTMPDADGTVLVGALGSTDNRLLRSDGAGGVTAQGSAVTVDDSGNISGVGTLAAGATTLSGLLTLSAGQLAFPASQNPSAGANALDDYEEGTWTCGNAYGGGTTGITYAGRLSTYTKMGRYVDQHDSTFMSSKGSSTGTATLTGMPFTTTSRTSQTAYVSNMSGLASVVEILVDYGATTATFAGSSATGNTNLTDTSFTNSAIFYWDCGYST